MQDGRRGCGLTEIEIDVHLLYLHPGRRAGGEHEDFDPQPLSVASV